MASLIEELLTVLGEQAENYENLLALSQEKKDVVVANDLEGLQRITGVENAIIGANQRLEKARAVIVRDIAHVLGRNEKDFTLSALREAVREQAEYGALTAVQERIRAALAALSAANEQNKSLIHNALDYIDFSINLIKGISAAPPGYDQSGPAGGDDALFFDAKQ